MKVLVKMLRNLKGEERIVEMQMSDDDVLRDRVEYHDVIPDIPDIFSAFNSIVLVKAGMADGMPYFHQEN